MSSSKQSISGLRTVKRDWSAPSLDSDPIPWSPSPPPEAGRTTTSSKPAPPKRSARDVEARLRAIQAALDEGTASKGVLASSTVPNARKAGSSSSSTMRPPATGSSSGVKRSSDPGHESGAPAAKRRLLPDSWNSNTATSSSSSVTSTSSFKRTSSLTSNGPSVVKIAPSTNTGSKTARVFLSKEQTQILKLVEDGSSIFYTGSAGTGKSVLLREIIRSMKRRFAKAGGDAVAITASTGLAACNIGGMTIHSFAGIGLGTEPAEELAVKVRKNKKAMTRWLRCKVLIIDEVSMVEADLFDKLCKLGSILTKRSHIPFGGIQVVVTGDFFQLPPVVKSGETKFAFEAESWGTVIKRTFNLTKVFRQKDQEFVDMLNEMRFGRLSNKSIARWKSLSREVEYKDGINATELFPRREEVDRSNHRQMTSLATEQHTYLATDGGHLQDEAQREKMLVNFMAAKSLILRVGAQVMLIKNTDELLVNGSVGTIKRFVDPAVYQSEKGDFTIEGKDESGGTGKKKAPPAASGVVWPVVQFSTPKGTVELMVEPATWKVEHPNGEVQVSRTQLPLILSWAMSIHKSQGQTLERVKVDLGKIFEKGQAYVALSRATSLDALQVLNFDPQKVNAHPKVVAWSKTLEVLKS